jgi:hypothetical protein
MPDGSSRLLLEADLRAFAHDLDAGLGDRDLSGAVTTRLTTPPSVAPLRQRTHRRRGVAVALVAGIVLTATVAIPPARAAIADFFDIGVVRIHEGPPPRAPATGGPLLLGAPTTLEAARAQMPVVVPTLRGFRTPDGIWFDSKAGGVTSLAYRARPGLPASEHTGVGLLVQEFRGDGRGMLNKYLTNSHAQAVMIGSDQGVFISGGDHSLFYEDPSGADVYDNGRLAGNALIFQRGPLTIRLEGDLAQNRMVAIAKSLG